MVEWGKEDKQGKKTGNPRFCATGIGDGDEDVGDLAAARIYINIILPS
jgi:hypothetical protein